jgi:4-diphosphocytidyl-2-C-methyl-D-erythritol kinase
MKPRSTPAPAKVNLGLFVGPRRAGDDRHELVTVMQSLSLADTVTLAEGPSGAEADEVICPGVPGPPERNLAALALAAFRSASGWRAPPLTLTIEKRIPIAAGLAGGSADAAATLRLAAAASGLGDNALLLELAEGLGADISAQLRPGRWLASGAGEKLAELPAPSDQVQLLLLPFTDGLSTASVYAESDRLGIAREPAELQALAGRLREALGQGASLPADAELLANDLQAAAISLRPEVTAAIGEVRDAGAQIAFVSGSGPTVVGMFSDPGAREDLRRARELLGGRVPAAIACAFAGS